MYYTGQDESAPVFGYLLSAIRALATTPHADHAVGFLAHSFWVQPYCFMVWHRDLLDFASDLLWLLPTVLEEDTCCLDPTIRRAEDPISELVTLTKAAAGPAPDLGRWDDFHGHRPREWLRPRLREEHLACFLGQLDAVAEGIRAVSSDDVVEIGGGCDECSFVQTEPGGCLWAKGGAFSYVEQFYLRLAARVCSGLHMA
ncbi:MAG: hypothetical protein FJX75_20745 [Armatimonadetes bacterium]|nr:hypothetical protein [Armatimonadota bacterium]